MSENQALSSESMDTDDNLELQALIVLTGIGILVPYAVVWFAIATLLELSLPWFVGLVVGSILVTVAVGSYMTVRVVRSNPPLTRSDYPDIHDTVDSLCEDLGIAKPELYLDPGAFNASAFGLRSRGIVLVGTELMEETTEEELEAVIAHELAHLHHRDSILTLAVSTAQSHLSRVGRWVALIVIKVMNAILAIFYDAAGETEDRKARNRRQWLQKRLAFVVVFCFVGPAVVFGNALSRVREYEADRLAAQSVDDPEQMVGLLEVLEAYDSNESSGPLDSTRDPDQDSPSSDGVIGRFSGKVRYVFNYDHPTSRDRIRRIQSLFGTGDDPAGEPSDPVFSDLKQFGLFRAPLALVLVPPMLMGYGVYQPDITQLPWVASVAVLLLVLGLAALMLYSLFAFPWAMTFHSSGSRPIGLVAAPVTILFLVGEFLIHELLTIVGYVAIVALAAVQLYRFHSG